MPAMSEPPLPESCDVLVVGAGPAGSACAQMLARSGLQVLLADQHAFPRDKVCGDGLIPDAHHALRKLGVYEEVIALAQPAQHVGCIGPRGGRVDRDDRRMRHRRSHEDGVQRALGRGVVHVPAPTGQEPLILEPPHGLRFAETVHECLHLLPLANPSLRRAGVQSLRLHLASNTQLAVPTGFPSGGGGAK